MAPRNIKIGLPVPQYIEDNPFLYKVWFDSQEPVAYEISLIKTELKRIAQLHDPREQFVYLMRVEERLDLLSLPPSFVARSSIQTKFRLMSFIRQWYDSRKAASS